MRSHTCTHKRACLYKRSCAHVLSHIPAHKHEHMHSHFFIVSFCHLIDHWVGFKLMRSWYFKHNVEDMDIPSQAVNHRCASCRYCIWYESIVRCSFTFNYLKHSMYTIAVSGVTNLRKGSNGHCTLLRKLTVKPWSLEHQKQTGFIMNIGVLVSGVCRGVCFLDAFSHLYKRVYPSVRSSVCQFICPSVRPSVGSSIRRFICPSVRPSVGHTRVKFLRNGPNLNKIAPGIRKYAI